ncbi:MAG: preprotein translocase subunit YajC [Hyphomonadaceae bacterium]|nr:preprotein translocase subunit YajC [Hyphomonadaceae bacterium]
MFITPAYAQAAAGGTGNPLADTLIQLLPIVFILVIFYFLLIRPQQKRLKQHQEMIAALKRGDTIVTSGGLIGKVRSVADDEVRVELAPNVEVRVVRQTISEVRGKGEPAPANDSKPAAD